LRSGRKIHREIREIREDLVSFSFLFLLLPVLRRVLLRPFY
jgi:hypothetical protein